MGRATGSKRLSLAGTGLETIPPEVFEQPDLEVLDLSENRLRWLPLEIGQLGALRKLYLFGNKLWRLPPEIGQLTELRELYLFDNRLSTLPPEIHRLTALRELYLHGNKLGALPPEIGRLTALRELNLPGNQLTALPREIGQLTALRELYLGGNQLMALPREIGQLTALRKLYLGGNQLTALPREIGQLALLEVLVVEGNQLGELPPEIGRLTALKALSLEHNQLKALPPEIGQLGTLRGLSLALNQLRTLPPEIGRLAALRELHLHDNQLGALPPEIGQLTKLRGLHLHDNQLKALPPEIGQLTELREAYFHRNQLRALPSEIGRLTALRELNLDGNALAALPPKIGGLCALERLDLDGNQIKALPPEIGRLATLRVLCAQSNRLMTLPPEIGRLTALKRLNVARNRLSFLPKELESLPELEEVEIAGNGFDVPRWVSNRGKNAALRYHLDQHEVRYEAKLVLLGHGNEGKTCLSRALRGLDFEHQRTTRGVNVDELSLRNPDDRDRSIKLWVWDFEGQEIHHQTHQFFLTQRSLYVIVFKGREELRLDALEYWLDTVRARAPGCKVLLAATECEHRNPAIDVPWLRARHRDMLPEDCFFPVGAENMRNIAELRRRIAELSLELELVPQSWPESFVKAERAIRNRGRIDAFVSRRQLCGLLDVAGLEGSELHDQLAGVFGDMGVLTHFPDCPELADFVVLNPRWLTKAISVAMEDDELTRTRGEITTWQLRALWRDDYPGLFSSFFACMREFELCYQVEHNPGLVLVPLRFAYERPRIIPWRGGPGLRQRRIEYRFDARPPAGLMSRFIVKTHHLVVRGDTEHGVFWRDGVFLESPALGGAQALCSWDGQRSKLTLQVRGRVPEVMVEQLDYVARAVLAFWPGLTATRYYGCVRHDGAACDGMHAEDVVADYLSVASPFRCVTGSHWVTPLSIVRGLHSFARTDQIASIVERVVSDQFEKRQELWQSFGLELPAVLARLDALATKIDEAAEHVSEEVALRLQQSQRELLSALQEEEVSRTPRLYLVVPHGYRAVDPRKLFKSRYRLRFFCEHDHPHPSEATIEFEADRHWWSRARKPLSIALKLVGAVMKLGLPTVGVAYDEETMKLLRTEVKLATELVGQLHTALPDAAGAGLDDEEPRWWLDGPEYDELEPDTRRAYAAVSRLVKREDETSYLARAFGDLTRRRMGDGSFRWLCPEHAPKRIEIPDD